MATSTGWERIELSPSSYLLFKPDFMQQAEAQFCMQALLAELPWAQRTLRMFGRDVLEPRLVAWIGDPDTAYTYSGRRNLPEPWTRTLRSLREQVTATVGVPFNAVLANLYRDGRDSMGMHRDDEPELGERPLVASLSLGASRRFVLRAAGKGPLGGEKHTLQLNAGSLLLMAGDTQREFAHGVPKQPAVQEPRINLTFRRVTPALS